MDCVIIAGGLPAPDSPMYEITHGESKALIKMGERTMLEHVMDALQGSKYIEDIVVVGLGSDLGMDFQRPVKHLPDHGSMVGNMLAGVKYFEELKPGTTAVMSCTSDVPLLTSAIVDGFIDSCQPLDKGLYYNFITKEVMDARFPESNRTFVKLKGGMKIAGGDLMIANPIIGSANEELWVTLTNARKHAWKIATIIGIDMFLKYIFRRIGIPEIEKKASEILGLPIKVVLSPYAEIGMDADKPHQVEMLRAELEG